MHLVTYIIDYKGRSHEIVTEVPPEGIDRYLRLTPVELLRMLPRPSQN